MEPVELTGDGLTLRAWRDEDAGAVHRAWQDPELRRWAPPPGQGSLADARAFMIGWSHRTWAENTGARFGVFDSASGDLLGYCGLEDIDLATGVADLGYWTAPWARRQRVAERASRLIARWGFEQLGLLRLAWRAQHGNHVSRLVALRLGFRLEGTVRRGLLDADSQRVDGWLGSLLPGELRTADEIAGDPDLARIACQVATFVTDQPTLVVSEPWLALRPIAGTDLDDMTVACRDPDMVRFTTVPQPYHRANAEWYHDFADRCWLAGSAVVYAIADPQDRFCGTIDLRLDPAATDIAEVGYSVAPWARQRGYGTAALRALSRWAFDALAVRRIEWRANVGNHASRRTAERAGFTVEGTERGRLRHRGRPIDTWYGALLDADL